MLTVNLEQAISTNLKSFDNIKELKKEQLLVVHKLVEKRRSHQIAHQIREKPYTYQVFPGVSEALCFIQGEPWPEHPVWGCPLNSIMKEQVECLRRNNVSTFFAGVNFRIISVSNNAN